MFKLLLCIPSYSNRYVSFLIKSLQIIVFNYMFFILFLIVLSLIIYFIYKGWKASHNNVSSEPYSPHFLVREPPRNPRPLIIMCFKVSNYMMIPIT